MGNFPQPTDQMFDLVNDGTLWYYTPTVSLRTSLSAISQTNVKYIAELNNSYFDVGAVGSSTSSFRSIVLLFPQPRDISYISGRYTYSAGNIPNAASGIFISTDTTTGYDGAWNLMSTDFSFAHYVAQPEIFKPRTITLNNVKGFEWRLGSAGAANWYMYNLNLWGTFVRDTGLVFWDGTNNTLMSNDNFDFGNVLPSTTTVREFRVKNSYSQTANTITISAPTGYVDVGSIRSNLEFSDDGTNYAGSVIITSLSPGTISTKIYVRRTALSTITQNQISAASIMAIPASWS